MDAYCVNCANLGTKGGCPICAKVRSKDSLRFERYRREDARVKAMSQAERKAYADQRGIDLREREEAIDQARRDKDLVKWYKLSWEKLRDFKMGSTGDLEFDQKLRDKYGDWK